MALFRRFALRVHSFFHPGRAEQDFARELTAHLSLLEDHFQQRGLTRDEARFAARRASGGIEQAKELHRDARSFVWLEDLRRDLSYGVRSLVRSSGFTVIAVMTLALGIGANAAIFSLVNTLFLRSLPVIDPQRLAIVSSEAATNYRPPYSYAVFEQIQQHGALFDGSLAYSLGKVPAVVGADTPRLVDRLFVSGGFFSTLGVQPFLGRMFTLADDVPGGGGNGRLVVISHRWWQERLGGAAGVIGTSLTLDGVPVTIVGVTPPEFLGMEVGRTFDIALPIRAGALDPRRAFDADTPWLNILLRLKPGQSLEAGTNALRAVQPQIRAGAFPRTFQGSDFLKEPFTLAPVGTGTSTLRDQFQRPLVTVFVLVVLVLLIACANLANLLLARSMARRHELSVRRALGASRWRLTRQLLIESGVLASMGAIVGLLLSTVMSRALVTQLSTSSMPIVLDVSLDGRVLAFTAAAMIATTLLVGIAPALHSTRVAPMASLNDHSRGGGGDGRTYVGSSLIVIQVGLSLMLVVGAGLFVRTFERLAHASLGFDRDRALVVTVNASTISGAERNNLYHRLVTAAAGVPGVDQAGGSINPPLVGSLVGDVVVAMPGVAPLPDAERISQTNTVTPGWLGAYGTTVRDGRDVDERDTATAPPVMLVNEAFVRRFFAGRSVIGTTLAVTARLLPNGDFPLGPKTVVGVVSDTVFRSIRGSVRPTLYFPLAQWGEGAPLPYTTFHIAVRSSTESPALLARSVAAALTGVNRDLVVTFRPLAQQVKESLVQERLVAMLSGVFGVLSLSLAGLGLYGVTSYAVIRRRVEIGIRVALGAPRGRVIRLVMSRVIVSLAIGLTLGVVMSLWASQFVASLIYGVQPRDPATLILAVIILLGVGVLAGWLPARRAVRIDPAQVIREA